MTVRAQQPGAPPIYLRVADELERAMSAQEAGSPLASENELALSYGVSRLTARAALEELERRFLVRRSQGRRAFVARRIEYNVGPDTAPSWTQTVLAGGGVPRSETVILRLRRAPASVRAALELSKTREALFLARERYVDDELSAYAETWLAADVVPDLDTTLGANGSLYDAFESSYRLQPARARSRAEFVVASAPIARKLRIDGRPMLFRLDGQTDSGRLRRPIEMTTSWLRADIFRIVFALERGRP